MLCYGRRKQQFWKQIKIHLKLCINFFFKLRHISEINVSKANLHITKAIKCAFFGQLFMTYVFILSRIADSMGWLISAPSRTFGIIYHIIGLKYNVCIGFPHADFLFISQSVQSISLPVLQQQTPHRFRPQSCNNLKLLNLV